MDKNPAKRIIRVLFDGWQLVHSPNSTEALHLLLLIDQSPPEVHGLLALPGDPPDWLPSRVESIIEPGVGVARSRLAWEQRTLPKLFQQAGADLLHLTAAHPPLMGAARTILSPAGPGSEGRSHNGKGLRRSFQERVRTAATAGGMSRLSGLLWPEDLSDKLPPEVSAPVYYLSVEPALTPGNGTIETLRGLPGLELPETYILCHASSNESVHQILRAWSWAAGAIGEYYPLILLGLEPGRTDEVSVQINSYQLERSVRALPVLPPELIPPLYQGAAAVFQPDEPHPWGSPLRAALRCSRPLVAAESPLADGLVGSGAYLAPPTNPRALGAGVITVIVEESIAEMITQSGKARAETWNAGSFQEKLYSIYQKVLGGSGK